VLVQPARRFSGRVGSPTVREGHHLARARDEQISENLCGFLTVEQPL